MSIINNKHLARHGLTADAYRSQFPNCPLVSDAVAEKLSQRSIRSNAGRKGVKRSEADKEAIRRGIAANGPRVAHNRGVAMTDEEKRKRSEKAIADFASGKRKARTGLIASAETRAKISATLSGRKVGPGPAMKALETKRKKGIDLGANMRGKRHSEETKKRIADASREWQARRRPELRIPMGERILQANLTLLNDITADVFNLRCNSCSYLFTRTSQMFDPCRFREDICDQCHPISPVSKAENEVAAFVAGMGASILRSEMELISPLELDIVVPERSIAIEYCGLYWHSEIAGKNRWYHRHKMEACEKAGLRLFTIFEDEWINRPDIVRSVIGNAFGKSGTAVNARACRVERIESTTGNAFVDKYHLQGKGRATAYYGITHDDLLIGVMSFSDNEVSRKGIGWDINRFCVLPGYSVRGGAGRLFSAFQREFDPDTVVSYADLRYGTGNVYGQLGFSLEGRTVPGYWYFRPNEMRRYHRYGLRKNEADDQALTEWENRRSQGWNRIWDCGHAKWVWNRR